MEARVLSVCEHHMAVPILRLETGGGQPSASPGEEEHRTIGMKLERAKESLVDP